MGSSKYQHDTFVPSPHLERIDQLGTLGDGTLPRLVLYGVPTTLKPAACLLHNTKRHPPSTSHSTQETEMRDEVGKIDGWAPFCLSIDRMSRLRDAELENNSSDRAYGLPYEWRD
jgi:hypothetical protein